MHATGQPVAYQNNAILQILVSTVPLLTDNDLVSLGVQTVGERAELRKKCRDSLQRE